MLSDGNDHGSNRSAHEVITKLQTDNVIVDAICVGGKPNEFVDLKRICKYTGGYVFNPFLLRHALSAVELETVLLSTERPSVAQPRKIYTYQDSQFSVAGQNDVVDDHTAPARNLLAL